MDTLPILYSYRRCPYAMRARMAILYGEKSVYLREIHLKDKPKHLLQVSPKGTVPVLITEDQKVIDESIDIMLWALADHPMQKHNSSSNTSDLLQINDTSFKTHLDRYKYTSDNDPTTKIEHRSECQKFLNTLEFQLLQKKFLIQDRVQLEDLAIFPFIRQFAQVDLDWFNEQPYPNLHKWLQYFLTSSLFQVCMEKHPTHTEDSIDYIYGTSTSSANSFDDTLAEDAV